jgi:ATP-binding cassette subfamily B protein
MTGTLSLGEFVSFSMYLGLLIWPVIAIGWVITLLQRGIASSKRLMEVMNEEPDVQTAPAPEPALSPREFQGRIEYCSVSFRYAEGDRWVLRDIDFTVPAGSSLGIMGRPGSGKSTLVSLLFRLFPLQRGEILLDRIRLEDLPLTLLRQAIGYVPQDAFLFSETVEKNIAFGLDEYDHGQVEHYARLVGLHDEIESFTEGYQSLIGERGVTLSGGQKQRLSIARALLIKPRILVLDDALSMVDAQTEGQILPALFKETRDRTAVIISHRVSTVRDCDRILVLDDGRIQERGSHQELLELQGYYSRLYDLQRIEDSVV